MQQIFIPSILLEDAIGLLTQAVFLRLLALLKNELLEQQVLTEVQKLLHDFLQPELGLALYHFLDEIEA